MRSLRLLAVAVLAVAAAQEEEEEGDFKSENARRRDEAAKYTYCEEDNCYDLLGVKQTSLAFAIKRAYRRLAAEWHPDKNPDPMAREKFQKFANAYSVLADTEMRANYDYLLEHKECVECQTNLQGDTQWIHSQINANGSPPGCFPQD